MLQSPTFHSSTSLKNRITPLGWAMPFPKCGHSISPSAPRRNHPQVAMLDLFLRIFLTRSGPRMQHSRLLLAHVFYFTHRFFIFILGTQHKMHSSVEFTSGLLILVPNLPSVTGFPGGFSGAIECREYRKIGFH